MDAKKKGLDKKKDKLEKIGRKLEGIDKELAKIERDLSESKNDGEDSIVDEDMKQRQKQKPRLWDTGEERPLPEYRGVGLFYRKFVSRLKNSLK